MRAAKDTMSVVLNTSAGEKQALNNIMIKTMIGEEKIRKGQKLTFNVVRSDKGLEAIGVRLLSQS